MLPAEQERIRSLAVRAHAALCDLYSAIHGIVDWDEDQRRQLAHAIQLCSNIECVMTDWEQSA